MLLVVIKCRVRKRETSLDTTDNKTNPPPPPPPPTIISTPDSTARINYISHNSLFLKYFFFFLSPLPPHRELKSEN